MSCVCQECKSTFKIDINVNDETWELIKPRGKAKGAGLLCGACIMERIESIGEYDYFYLIKGETKQLNIEGDIE
jgi:hypothetical protein